MARAPQHLYAHFPGSGPTGRFCRECQHWAAKDPNPFKAGPRCIKALSMKPGATGGCPASTLACKYFAERGRS